MTGVRGSIIRIIYKQENFLTSEGTTVDWKKYWNKHWDIKSQ